MAFERIDQTHPGRGTPLVGVRMGTGKDSSGKYVARLVFGADVLDQMRWAAGTRIVVERGTGKDAGTARLTAGNLTGWRLGNIGHSNKSPALRLPALSDGQFHPSMPVEHRVSNGALYVTLPEWANGTE